LRHARHHAVPQLYRKARGCGGTRQAHGVKATPDLTPLGIAVGHATDERGATGITVVRGIDRPMRAGVAVFGRASGSRELLTASPDHLVEGRADAIVLTGGSAYGLDATAGVMRWLEEQGRGYPLGAGVIPIVPAAVVFDLAPLGRFDARPTPDMAYAAVAQALPHGFGEGSVGAGTGTTVGKLSGMAAAMKGGFGCSMLSGNGIHVAAMVVVNALGDVCDSNGAVIAGARSRFVTPASELTGLGNTTLAVVACSVALTATQLTQLARAAGAALFRRITPAGTSADGDTVFAVSAYGDGDPRMNTLIIETLAVQALEDAIERAVRLARGRDGIPGLADDNGN
jgi:L-aminopeptidase/D-esterase-like protein